jgi:hypothetical protein
MNELAFKHSERLGFAARRLARDIATMRNEFGLVNLYQELYAARQARFAAVTTARLAFNRWLRKHPKCTVAQVRKALEQFQIPQTREELTEAIRKIEREAVAAVRRERSQQ